MKKRTNIVLTSDRNYKVKDAIVVHTVEALLQTLKAYKQEDIYVIGGESVYRQLLPYCDTAHITKIDHVYEADTYFPNLVERVCTDNCCLTVIQHISQKLIMSMRQILIFRIWIRMRNGRLQESAKNRLILIWNMNL